jgi:hypothetical protein
VGQWLRPSLSPCTCFGRCPEGWRADPAATHVHEEDGRRGRARGSLCTHAARSRPIYLILGHLAHFPHRGFQARLRYESTLRSPEPHRHTQSLSHGRPPPLATSSTFLLPFLTRQKGGAKRGATNHLVLKFEFQHQVVCHTPPFCFFSWFGKRPPFSSPFLFFYKTLPFFLKTKEAEEHSFQSVFSVCRFAFGPHQLVNNGTRVRGRGEGAAASSPALQGFRRARPALQGFRRARRPRVGVQSGGSGVGGSMLAGRG